MDEHRCEHFEGIGFPCVMSVNFMIPNGQADRLAHKWRSKGSRSTSPSTRIKEDKPRGEVISTMTIIIWTKAPHYLKSGSEPFLSLGPFRLDIRSRDTPLIFCRISYNNSHPMPPLNINLSSSTKHHDYPYLHHLPIPTQLHLHNLLHHPPPPPPPDRLLPPLPPAPHPPIHDRYSNVLCYDV